jgi:superfamily II DNA or RNA helicase
VLPTGGGKTVIFSRLVADFGAPVVVIAHRKELVSQISRSLAAEGVTHRVIAPRETVRMIASANSRAFGQAYISPTAPVGVAGVDSLGRVDERWAASIKLVVQDEAHHMLQANKWGKALARFPNAQLVGFTATPERSDGKGLGKHADGFFTDIVPGPTMRDLIDAGHLSDYRLFAPESTKLDLSAVPTSSATGDYNQPKLRSTMHAAKITGDVVNHYLDLASGKLGLTFVTDVEAAKEIAEAYRAAGVPAEAISAKTPPAERSAAIRRFARRELLQLVNVDLFGEGFDLASAAGMDVCVEAASMVRPTQSFGVWCQQFGRALRLGPGKTRAIVIDHVGNTMRHNGPPDMPRPISLDARAKGSRGKPDDVPMIRICVGCSQPYPRERTVCPYCGHEWKPAARRTPEDVEGDLVELDPETLARLHRAAAKAMRTDDEARAHYGRMGLPAAAVGSNVKRCRLTREAQDRLRQRIAEVAGQWRAAGADDSTIHRRFWLRYGIDIASACGLGAAEADKLYDKTNT